MMRLGLLIGLLVPLSALAINDAPQTLGFSGAMRSGLPTESVFGNPAAVNFVQQNTVYGYYTNSQIKGRGLGGRVRTAGVYDGSNKYAKAGFAYVLESRPRYIQEDLPYFDRNEFRLAVGRMLSQSISVGVLPRYVIRKFGEDKEEKVIDGDAGVIYTFNKKIRLGALYENIRGTEEEKPGKLGGGARFDMSENISFTGDYWRILTGDYTSANSWAVGGEVRFYNEFLLRAGIGRDGQTGLDSRSVGLTYFAPRAVAEISYKFSGGDIDQRDLLFALSIHI